MLDNGDASSEPSSNWNAPLNPKPSYNGGRRESKRAGRRMDGCCREEREGKGHGRKGANKN